MSPQPHSDSPLTGLQFGKAEYEDNRPKCGACRAVLEHSYYQLAGQNICPTCAEVVKTQQGRPKNTWVMRGALYGAGMAAGCSIVYAIITWVTHMELALIAILVGYLIGKAVRKGSNGLGGRRCQVLAVALTYIAITFGYIPLVVKSVINVVNRHAAAATEQQKAGQPGSTAAPPAKPPKLGPVAAVITIVAVAVVVVAFALAAPFIKLSAGLGGILGLFIIFLGLQRAWQLTARDNRLLMGPYELEGQPASA